MVLKVNSGGGNGRGSAWKPKGVKPVATFTASVYSGYVPLTVNFTSTISQGSTPITYAWDFGDGETSTAANPTHIFASAGTFNVKLTVSNSYGSYYVIKQIVVSAVALPPPPPPPPPPAPPPAPFAKMWTRVTAMLIGKKTYSDATYQAEIAQAAVAILAPYNGQFTAAQTNAFIAAIKVINPDIKLGCYTNIVEVTASSATSNASADIYNKCVAANWMLKKVDGTLVTSKIQSGKHDINITSHAPVDGNGDRIPQWLAQRDYEKFFQGKNWDLYYVDNSNDISRQWESANWKNDGVNRSAINDTTLHAPFRQGMANWWTEIKTLNPTLEVYGNPDGGSASDGAVSALALAEYTGLIHGSFFENGYGPSTSFVETWAGWQKMMDRLVSMQANTLAPKRAAMRAVIPLTNYQKARYAICSVLLTTDCHICITEEGSANAYSAVHAFDEYEQRLGDAVGANYSSSGTIRYREYDGGLVLVNISTTTSASIDVTAIGAGLWIRFNAADYSNQDPLVNNGEVATTVTLSPKDGIVLLRNT